MCNFIRPSCGGKVITHPQSFARAPIAFSLPSGAIMAAAVLPAYLWPLAGAIL